MKKNYFVLFFAFFLLATVVFVSQERGDAAGNLLQYISPRPGAELVSAETTIAFRLNGGGDLDPALGLEAFVSVTAEGEQSGGHVGKLILADDGQTVIFEPVRPFAYGEIVSVSLDIQGGSRPFSYQYEFTVSPPLPIISDAERWPELFAERPDVLEAEESADPLPPYRTVPYDFPNLDVYTAPGTEDGYVFLSHFHYASTSNGKAYLLMLGNDGELVYYKRLYPLLAALDFKKQPNGLLTYFDAAQKVFRAMDNQYNEVGIYRTGNGYITDLHDLQVLANDQALLMSYDYKIIDMSVIVPGGNPQALVIGCIIQEIDGQGNVIFEWRSWDHIPITDTNQNLTADIIDYIHCNSLEKDTDGHILISSRHLDEVTKINRQTGGVIWRLGGSQNQFTFPNDPGFFHQHDARRLPNGRISVYDNRNYQVPVYSRGVEYIVDEVNKVATRVYEYRHPLDVFGGAMGNYQRLPGGNALVGWGWSSTPVLTEALADGTTVFELSADDLFGTYRAFRFSWQGYPTWPPQLVGYAEGQTVTLYFSYNGATEVAGYRIYGDMNPVPTTILAGVLKDGFETTFTYNAPSDGIYYFRVMPVTSTGAETQYSNILPVYIGGSPVFMPMVGRE